MRTVTRETTSPTMPAGTQMYEASFKKSGSGKLRWVQGPYASEKEATEGLKAFAADRLGAGYRLYGGPSLMKPRVKRF